MILDLIPESARAAGLGVLMKGDRSTDLVPGRARVGQAWARLVPVQGF